MSDRFDPIEFVREHPLLFSSITHEKLASGWKPKSLEELGVRPEKVLGEGDYKNHLYQKLGSLKPGIDSILPSPNPFPPRNPFEK